MDDPLEVVKRVLAHNPHVAIATVNDDGTPHNSPVFGTFNDKLHLFWASDPQAQHSQNIRRQGEIYAVVFDSQHGGPGLYLAGRAQEVSDSDHLDYAHNILAQAKARFGGKLGSRERYEGEGPQRLYRMIPESAWLNRTTKDDDGFIITDTRLSVALNEITL